MKMENELHKTQKIQVFSKKMVKKFKMTMSRYFRGPLKVVALYEWLLSLNGQHSIGQTPFEYKSLMGNYVKNGKKT